MPRFSYVNGRYLSHYRASVSIEDRGLQFSDGVYEVIGVCNSFPVDLKRHINRLQRSMRELDFKYPPKIGSLIVTLRNIIKLKIIVLTHYLSLIIHIFGIGDFLFRICLIDQ